MTSVLASRLLTAAAAGGVVAFLSSGGAHAITSAIFQYSAARTGYYPIGSSALTPDSDNAAASYVVDDGTGALNGTGCFQTEPHLPNGATIAGLTVWFDSNASDDPIFVFTRRDLVTGAKLAIVSGPVHNDTTNRVQHTFTIPKASGKVINSNYSFTFAYCGQSNDDHFYGARVAYTYTNAGD